MLTIITLGPFTQKKQSKTVHVQSNLKVNSEKIDFDNQK